MSKTGMEVMSTKTKKVGFAVTAGININPLDPKSTLLVLKRLISQDMIGNFVHYTNDYAYIIINMPKIQERINKFKKSMFSKWTPTNRDEMWMYLTITLIMGIVQKPEFDMYLTNDTLFKTPLLLDEERMFLLTTVDNSFL